MALDDLNEKLHSRGVHLDRARRSDTFEPDESRPDSQTISKFQQGEGWNESAGPKNEFTLASPIAIVDPDDAQRKKRMKKIILALGGIASLILLGGIVMKLRASLFDEEKIRLNFSGPSAIASTEPVTFTFEYTNDNWLALKDSTVIFEYPATFHPEPVAGMTINTSRAELKIGEIGIRGSGTIAFSGKFYGSRGDRAGMRATLRYTPNNTSSTFEKRTERSINVASSSLFFEITAPLERASEQEVQYDIRYHNQGDISFTNLKVKLEYPAGFSFIEAVPSPSDNTTVWQIGTLAPGQEGTIAVRGKLSGERDEQKSVQGGIGYFQGDGTFIAYGENERKTRMVASPLTIKQTVNGQSDIAINPGEELSYVITYKNEGNVGIRDAIVTAELDSPYVDFGTLAFRSGKGTYNQSLKTILWKASDVPALARVEVGQGGSLSFSLKTYSDPEKRGRDVKNPSIRSVAKIDSPDIPAIVGITKVVASNTLIVKLHSVVSGELKGFYADGTFPNTGPIPPTVGQETTYTFHFSLTNSINDLAGARVSISLPSGIRYTGKKSPENEKIIFNERTNEFVWDVGLFVAGTKRELIFQIGVTPALNTIGASVDLVGKSIFTAKDSFTGKEIKFEKPTKMSDLTEDSSITSSGYHVQAASQ